MSVMEEVPVRGGTCRISDDAVRIDVGLRNFVRQKYESDPVLVGTLLVAFVGSVVAEFTISASLILLETVPEFLFDVIFVVIGAQVPLALGIFILAMWWVVSRRRAQRAGTLPENLTDDGVIPHGWIDSVGFSTFRDRPTALIHYREDGESGEKATRPVIFEKDSENEVERMKRALRARDVRIED